MMEIITNESGGMYPYVEDEINKNGHTFRIVREFLNEDEQKELIRWFLLNKQDMVMDIVWADYKHQEGEIK